MHVSITTLLLASLWCSNYATALPANKLNNAIVPLSRDVLNAGHGALAVQEQPFNATDSKSSEVVAIHKPLLTPSLVFHEHKATHKELRKRKVHALKLTKRDYVTVWKTEVVTVMWEPQTTTSHIQVHSTITRNTIVTLQPSITALAVETSSTSSARLHHASPIPVQSAVSSPVDISSVSATSAEQSDSDSSAVISSATSVIASSDAPIVSSSTVINGAAGTSSSYASAASVIAPVVASRNVLGASVQDPAMEYINVQDEPVDQLPANLLTAAINQNLINDYSIWSGSGALQVNSSDQNLLEPLKWKPNLSRDGGKGGNVAGQNIFIFSDTEAWGPADGDTEGPWVGFVSNTAAVDKGMAAASGDPVVISDQIGEWAGDSGTPRNWVPFTTGEQAYNEKMAGKGTRFAIWPESSLIPYDSESALLYAPIVFTNTHGSPSGGLLFTSVGSTLLKVSIPGEGGPVAERIVPQLFPEGGPEWGCVGGIRSFGPSGVDGGSVYVFGNNKNGLLLGRTPIGSITDASSYEFWHSDGTWSSSEPSKDDPTDTFVNGAFSTADVFYSPRHLTWVIIYQNIYADNKLWYRYLMADHPIKPSFEGGSDEDFVENITKYEWSPEALLLEMPQPGTAYTYAGGMHMGYFGAEDITRGGNRMLVGWTSPTGKPAGSADTGYAFMTAEITWE